MRNYKKKKPKGAKIREILAENEAQLIAVLANLNRMCVLGNADAPKIMADLGLTCANLLREGLESPQSQKQKQAVELAVRNAQEWPISCPAIVDRRKLSLAEQIPPMLGECLPVRLGSSTGRGRRRKYDLHSQTGLADALRKDLEAGRKMAKKYPLYSAGFFGELIDQAMDADNIISQPHLLLSKSGPLLNADSQDLESIGDLMKVGTDGPEIDWEKFGTLCEKMIGPWQGESLWDEMTTFGPDGIEAVWEIVGALQDLSATTMGAWIAASLALVDARCNGKWATGPWRHDYADQVWKRQYESKNFSDNSEELAYRYIVTTKIKNGYKQLVKSRRFQSENLKAK